jgi:tRNA (Thr-GGU) A37 N-methylase
MAIKLFSLFLISLVSISVSVLVGPAQIANASGGAVVTDPGCSTYTLARNDDGSVLVDADKDFNFEVDWYGETYDYFALNNNGGIKFGESSWGQFSGLNLASTTNDPLIAVGFRDLDTRNSSTSPVTYGPLANPVLGYRGYCVNWLNIGDYNNGGPVKSFQLLLLDVDATNGDVILVMNYDLMGGGTVITGWAATGGQGYIFSGDLPASGSSAQLGTGAGSLVASSFAPEGFSATAGRYIFEIRGGAPADAPGAPEPPTSLVATATGSGTASLIFDESETSGVTNYTFQYRAGSGTWENVPEENITRSSNTANEVSFSGLTDGTSYSFRATSFKAVSSVPSDASNSVIPSAAPVVATTSSTETSGVVTVAGNVTSAGGATVTERGVVYGTSANPTINDDKISSGSGTGIFSASSGTLSPGTYYFRTFATNTNGTSYGSQETVIVKDSQSISWSPSTSLILAQSGITLGASLTRGDGTLGYLVVSQGTTGCAVSGAILSFTSTGSGANGCEVRPTASSTALFNAKTDAATVTFDITLSLTPTAPSPTEAASPLPMVVPVPVVPDFSTQARRLPPPPTVQQGPVLRGNVVPAPPVAPVATIGGRSTPIQTQVTSPTGFSLRAGVLNLGLEVQQDQGVVRQNNTGGTEIEVKKGSTAAVSGTGLLPRSTVQVFLPLQGTNAKEIARIPVDEAGSFSGDAVFATRVNERPLPIGKQVLQVVSLDEDGQQSVVEMTVNIAQSAPAPEPDRTAGATPTLRPGQFLATNAGEPEIVTVVPVPEDRQARVEGNGWQMAVDIPSANGSVAPSDEGGALLQLVRDETAVVSGTGFMPGTRADVWLFSEPTLLGTVDIDENGEFTGEVNIDSNVVVVGEHTLQLQGVGEDGYVRAANLGVVVNDTAAEVTTEEAAGGFLWWLWLLVVLVALVVWFAIWRYRRSREA